MRNASVATVVSFSGLSLEQKARRIAKVAAEAAATYYDKSAGIHVTDGGVERFIQCAIWADICGSDDGPRTYACIEANPADVLMWSGIKDGNSIFQSGKLKLVDARKRFDIVYYAGAGASFERPKGIIEVKISHTSEGSLNDLLRIAEFARVANMFGASIDFVASLFVEPISEVKLVEHKRFVTERCSAEGMHPTWFEYHYPYPDRRTGLPVPMLACVAAVGPSISV